MAQAISSDMQQLAAAYQLGTPQQEYGFKVTRTLITGLLTLVLGIGCIAFIFISEHISLSSIDFSYVDTSGDFWVFIIAGLVLLAVGIGSLVSMFRNLNLRVLLCTEGILRTSGSKVEIVRWDQVEAFWQAVTKRYMNGVYTGTTHIYTLRRADGVVFKFNDTINKVEALGNAVQREVTRVLLPKFIYAYNAGSTVTFGPLSINKQGISNSKEMLPWSQYKDMQVRRGIVSVKKEGKWLNWSSIGVARIPNFYVFMSLLDYAVKSQQQRPVQ